MVYILRHFQEVCRTPKLTGCLQHAIHIGSDACYLANPEKYTQNPGILNGSRLQKSTINIRIRILQNFNFGSTVISDGIDHRLYYTMHGSYSNGSNEFSYKLCPY